ncbi:hypothetical protein GA0115240_117711 [Streptomyces sp. DvalAA-14]|uniref:hypothetical protein n=1 Tax=unclassified Streptomyces TaxID=2593676 RepID=UPI00081B70E5|nr:MULTISPECIES: hypothetical protein [unclassified Streptomyces]SCD63742.1 hypothetical protein GA0115240_117711 [Streptomyces sp. DvalAA-14]
MTSWTGQQYPLLPGAARILRWSRWLLALALALAIALLVYSIASGAGRLRIIESIVQVALFVLLLANNLVVLRRHDEAVEEKAPNLSSRPV